MCVMLGVFPIPLRGLAPQARVDLLYANRPAWQVVGQPSLAMTGAATVTMIGGAGGVYQHMVASIAATQYIP